MMDRIAVAVEADPAHQARVHFTETLPDPTSADAIAGASTDIARTVSAAAIICFTLSGSTALATARRLCVLWGAHAVRTKDVTSFEEMVAKAKRMALRAGVAKAGDRVVIMAGVPFGTPGSTNVLHIVRLTGDELKGYAG